MPKEWQDLDYPPDLSLIRIRPEYVQLVDDVLLAALGRAWERMRDSTPAHLRHTPPWSPHS